MLIGLCYLSVHWMPVFLFYYSYFINSPVSANACRKTRFVYIGDKCVTFMWASSALLLENVDLHFLQKCTEQKHAFNRVFVHYCNYKDLIYFSNLILFLYFNYRLV